MTVGDCILSKERLQKIPLIVAEYLEKRICKVICGI